MRLVCFAADGEVGIAVLEDETVTAFEGVESVGAALERWLAEGEAVLVRGRQLSLDKVRLLPPIDRGARVFAIAQNFPAHASEMGGERPPKPVIFLKLASSLAAPGDLAIPGLSEFFDYEGELGAVVGRRCRQASPAQALASVAGYTVCNDGSARDLQPATLGGNPIIDWFSAKALDASSPVGPWIVTRDEVPEPQALRLTTRLNGEVVQDDRTSSMVFTVAEQLAFISERVTLEPGDLLMTGTPGGVGRARGRALRAGDEIEIEVESVGVLRTRYREPER